MKTTSIASLALSLSEKFEASSELKDKHKSVENYARSEWDNSQEGQAVAALITAIAQVLSSKNGINQFFDERVKEKVKASEEKEEKFSLPRFSVMAFKVIARAFFLAHCRKEEEEKRGGKESPTFCHFFPFCCLLLVGEKEGKGPPSHPLLSLFELRSNI